LLPRGALEYQNTEHDIFITDTSHYLFLLPIEMAAARKATYEVNEVYDDSESDSELDLEVEKEFETSERSDPDTNNEIEMSEDENTSSLINLNRSSRSWQKAIFRPKLFNFQSNHCRIIGNLNENSPLDIFKLFFDQKLIQFIVDETNKFQTNLTDDSLSTSSHQAKWSPTNPEEIYLFFATFMLMAHMKKYRIKDY